MTRLPTVFTLVGYLWLTIFTCVQPPVQAEPNARTTAESTLASADSLLLDQFPDTYAAFSLKRQSSTYSGPILTVRRGSDDATKDFALDGNKLDVSAIESWLSGSEGFVRKWHSQGAGLGTLGQDNKGEQPRIADASGTVFTDSDGRIAIKFDRSRGTFLTVKPDFGGTRGDDSWQIENSLTYVVGEKRDVADNPRRYIISHFEPFGSSNGKAAMYAAGNGMKFVSALNEPKFEQFDQPGWWGMRFKDGTLEFWNGNQIDRTEPISGSEPASKLTLGVETGNTTDAYDGFISEAAILDAQPSKTGVYDVYDIVNGAWNIGPPGYNRGALLPQGEKWMVDLYDWLETIEVSDVELSDGTLTYDNSYDTSDELADLWLQIEGLTASSVTRRTPEWYLLNNGNGKGIEATGVVRANHNPKGGSYGGNPPRSWQNEPAYWYQLDIPLSGGGQGNPWYKNDAMGRRAMIVSSVDLMMHAGNFGAGSSGYDFMGKAFLGMAEAYRWAGEVMTADAQEAYENGMEAVIDHLTNKGPKAVNTNMDTFALQGAADFYMATDDSTRQTKCVEMVKKALFGYRDGDLGGKHRVFARDKNNINRKGGVFNPAGFVMEGDVPDVFYGGESMYHLQGALEAVRNRDTDTVPTEWQFLENVIDQFQEWRTYQKFFDPRRKASGTDNSEPIITAGGGFNGRTGYGVPNGQGREEWSVFSLAEFKDEYVYLADDETIWETGMENDIADRLSTMDDRMSSYYDSAPPDEWGGFSPWTKRTTFLPPKGWYSHLRELDNNDDPIIEEWPALEQGRTWNKALGGGAETWNGDPLPPEYWSYKDTDSNGDEWGFFAEASQYQGTYPGWFGGKIETFWTRETGVLLINRHGKTGCDRSGVDDYSNVEDSFCWFNIDRRAAHHVWGRGDDGNAFTTSNLVSYKGNRTVNWDTEGTPPTVSISNPFHDDWNERGTQGSDVINGQFTVEHVFEVQNDGLKVTHNLTSDESDQVNMMWAGLPVYLRHNNPHREGLNLHENMNDTRIEYWDGSSWVELPEDTDNDDVPEIVSTDALRLGRDYEDGQGLRYGYINIDQSRKVRRSKGKYYDPYQSKTGVRTVHIDLHGDPGTAKTLPASRSVSYTIQTTDPT